jgi:hypothetical protein
MLYLLTPPRVAIYPGSTARCLRGGCGSVVTHVLIVAALIVAGTGAAAPVTGRAFRVQQVTALAASGVVTRREPEAPFQEKADVRPPATIPLTIRDAVSGDAFTIDLARIRQRRNDLFPFVTWDLRILGERPARDRTTGLEWPSPFAPAVPAGTKPLALSDDALQMLVDRAWSRRERWTNLAELVSLSDQYDADAGDLARAFNAYVTQNVPQPYEDWAFPDPVFWTTVTLAADDAPLVEFVLGYVRRHPASRVTTELLFLLDSSAETSCDVLADVLMAGTERLPLGVTQRGNPDAYDLALSLASAYRSWILKYHVSAAERCLAARTAILRRIIETSPERYGASDARFRLGELLWRLGRREDAVRWWRGIMPDERNAYGRVARELRGAIDDGAAEASPHRIDGLLLAEERRWRARIGDRLEYFGWTADKF